MSVIRTLKAIGGLTASITVMAFVSYCSEMPKYRFEQVMKETARTLPGARVIDSYSVIDLASPIEWIWPPKTTWTFAIPDPILRDRFFTMTAIYEEKDNPITYLVDVDCDDRTAMRYDLDEPESADPARNLFGEPVVAPNGKTYRRIAAKIEAAYPEPKKFMDAFCNTDWSAERETVGRAVYGPKNQSSPK